MTDTGPLMLVNGTAKQTHDVIVRIERETAVRTAVEVARDWAIEQHGNRAYTAGVVERYMFAWLRSNGADFANMSHDPVADVVDAVWALADLDADTVDPLTLVEDDFHGTSADARDWLRNRHEQDVQHALNRITWKD